MQRRQQKRGAIRMIMEHPFLTSGPTSDRHGWLKGYGLPLGVTLLALLARFVLDPFLGGHLPYVTFLGAVAVTTYYGMAV